jgi:hypothetical protein
MLQRQARPLAETGQDNDRPPACCRAASTAFSSPPSDSASSPRVASVKGSTARAAYQDFPSARGRQKATSVADRRRMTASSMSSGV